MENKINKASKNIPTTSIFFFIFGFLVTAHPQEISNNSRWQDWQFDCTNYSPTSDLKFRQTAVGNYVSEPSIKGIGFTNFWRDEIKYQAKLIITSQKLCKNRTFTECSEVFSYQFMLFANDSTPSIDDTILHYFKNDRGEIQHTNSTSFSADICRWNGCPDGYNISGWNAVSPITQPLKNGYFAIERWNGNAGKRDWYDEDLLKNISTFIPTYKDFCVSRHQRIVAKQTEISDDLKSRLTPEQLWNMAERLVNVSDRIERIKKDNARFKKEQKKEWDEFLKEDNSK
ncbi:MAG: hypothetical protein KDF58_06280 [Alphaproteobacteria bacterium]|nr:hypothetical protein [Alphaproteobacteria bacterium]